MRVGRGAACVQVFGGFSTGKTWVLVTGATGVNGERPVKE